MKVFKTLKKCHLVLISFLFAFSLIACSTPDSTSPQNQQTPDNEDDKQTETDKEKDDDQKDSEKNEEDAKDDNNLYTVKYSGVIYIDDMTEEELTEFKKIAKNKPLSTYYEYSVNNNIVTLKNKNTKSTFVIDFMTKRDSSEKPYCAELVYDNKVLKFITLEERDKYKYGLKKNVSSVQNDYSLFEGMYLLTDEGYRRVQEDDMRKSSDIEDNESYKVINSFTYECLGFEFRYSVSDKNLIEVEDYIVNGKNKTITLTSTGREKYESIKQ